MVHKVLGIYGLRINSFNLRHQVYGRGISVRFLLSTMFVSIVSAGSADRPVETIPVRDCFAAVAIPALSTEVPQRQQSSGLSPQCGCCCLGDARHLVDRVLANHHRILDQNDLVGAHAHAAGMLLDGVGVLALVDADRA